MKKLRPFKAALCAMSLAVPDAALADAHMVETYFGPLVECYEVATTDEARLDCKGRMSTVCMETEDGGFSTLGMVSCVAAETQVWDGFLNMAYQARMQGLAQLDIAEAVQFPEFANRADSLRTAQRAWIAFRDGECSLAYAMWGSGSMRQLAAVGCLLDMTAARTVELESLGEEMR